MTGCAGSHVQIQALDTPVSIPVRKPPSPATWPAYPHFSQHSCWGRPFTKGAVPDVERRAPSFAPAPRVHPIPPGAIAKSLLAHFGDRRYLRAITFRPAPPAVGSRVHVYYWGGHPPADALEAKIVDPAGDQGREKPHPSPGESLKFAIASWEAELVGGALRDDFCSAGGAPLVSWSGAASGFAEQQFALEQRFPNPAPSAFRKRVALVGKRYGFRVVTLRLLRPRQIAPLLVVETNRDRKAFSHDVPKIVSLLDPTSNAGHASALTFEGFLFAAEDSHGPFLETQSVSRGEAEGGEWAADNCYPYPTLGGPLGGGSGATCP
jgi:hypothetical protein